MSESPDRAISNIDSNCVARPKDKTPLRLRLGRILSSGELKSPKSPKSVSNSRGSSPSRGSPHAKMRYSWQSGTYFDSEKNQSPRTPESGISVFSSSKSSSISNDAANSPKSPSTPESPCCSMWYLADSAGAAKCATNEDDPTPPSRRASTVQTIASTYKLRDREVVPRLSSPLLSSPLSSSRFRCTLSPCSAERYASRTRPHRGGTSRVHQLEESTSELGERAAATKHESISGNEVLAAAATAAAEAEEVGEQRRRIDGRDVAVRCAGATQDLVDVVLDAGPRLPFAIHRHVRLDAGVSVGVDAPPGRLLRSPSASAGRNGKGGEREGRDRRFRIS